MKRAAGYDAQRAQAAQLMRAGVGYRRAAKAAGLSAGAGRAILRLVQAGKWPNQVTWSEAELATLRQLHEAGASPAQINAAIPGRSPNAIRKQRLCLYPETRRAPCAAPAPVIPRPRLTPETHPAAVLASRPSGFPAFQLSRAA